MIPKLLGRIHSSLASSPTLVRWSVKLRNQFNAVVSAHFSHLSYSTDNKTNGEDRFISLIAPHCQSFVDVGGNIGEWTAEFLRHTPPETTGLVFEANRSCAIRLTERFASHLKVQILAKAVSDYSGTADFFEAAENHQLSSLNAENAGQTAVRCTVPVTTLDEAVGHAGWTDISVLKIDTEGHDYFVLRSARNLLRQQRIGVIQFECNHTWAAAGATLTGAVNFLRDFGYETLQLRPDGLHRVDVNFYGPDLGYGNWIAFHPGTAALLAPLRRDD